MTLLRYLVAHPGWAVTLTATLLVAYGFEIFSFNLTIDEELFGAEPPLQFLEDGRWMLWLLGWLLLPVASIPTVPVLISLGGLAVALILVLRLLSADSKTGTVLACCAGLTLPTLFFLTAFSIMFGIGIGFVLAVIGVGLAVERSWQARSAAILCFVPCFAIYQSFVTVVLTLLLASAAGQLLAPAPARPDTTSVMRRLVESLAIVLIAVALYLLTWWAASTFVRFWAIPRNYIGETFFSPALPLEPWIWRWTLERMVNIYAGLADEFTRVHWSLAALMLASLFVIARAALSPRRSFVQLLVTGALIVGVLFVPFSLHLITGKALPVRALIALPLTVTVISALAINTGSRGAALVVASLCALVALHNAGMINQYAASAQMALAADRVLGYALAGAIQQQSGTREEPGPRFLAVVGSPDRSLGGVASTYDIFGRSFFDWDGGDSTRAVAFLKTLGLENTLPARKKHALRLVELQAAMAEWPAPGSVMRDDDLVIIKFGSFTRQQVRRICNPFPAASICQAP